MKKTEFPSDTRSVTDIDPDALRSKRLKRTLLRWGRKNFEDFPWRRAANHFHALAAELLLQRTRAEQVVPVYEEFVRQYPNPEALANSSPKKLKQVVGPLGLHWRIPLLLKLAKSLEGTGGVPTHGPAVESLPGVGHYAASAFLSLHLGTRSAIVDNNVVRFYARFFGFGYDGETRRKKWFLHLAQKMTPKRVFRDFNYALLDFTRAVCRPRPRCEICPLRGSCSFGKTHVKR